MLGIERFCNFFTLRPSELMTLTYVLMDNFCPCLSLSIYIPGNRSSPRKLLHPYRMSLHRSIYLLIFSYLSISIYIPGNRSSPRTLPDPYRMQSFPQYQTHNCQQDLISTILKVLKTEIKKLFKIHFSLKRSLTYFCPCPKERRGTLNQT